jgi:hypothetical protein
MSQERCRRFSQYKPLECALRRSKFKRPGVLAGILLECFLEHHGELRSDSLISEGVCEKGEFTNLRKRLIQGGWVNWSEQQTYKAVYFAGKKLLKYLNREKLATQELATIDDIIPKKQLQKEFERTRKRLSDVESRLSKVEDAIEMGINTYLKNNPPNNQERRKAAKKSFMETGTIQIN